MVLSLGPRYAWVRESQVGPEAPPLAAAAYMTSPIRDKVPVSGSLSRSKRDLATELQKPAGSTAALLDKVTQFTKVRELQALGRDREAIEALRRASASSSSAGSDAGPPVAPAARDRLTDLGESP